jgi:hypothetical protein
LEKYYVDIRYYAKLKKKLPGLVNFSLQVAINMGIRPFCVFPVSLSQEVLTAFVDFFQGNCAGQCTNNGNLAKYFRKLAAIINRS